MAQAQYRWGQPVTASGDLYNDGSYPDVEPAALLVEQGSAGEVVQVGRHTETETPVYLVEFANGRVVGCFEQDLAPA